MKKLSVLIMVVTLLTMNFVGAAHADCTEAGSCDGMQIVKSIDDSGSQDGDKQKVSCDCCASCSHHNHSHIAFVGGNAESIAVSSQTLHVQAGEKYLSQLQHPPSRPPRA